MQNATLDRRIFLRVDDRLVTAAKAKASQEGVSLSALVRNAVSRDLRGTA